MDQNNSLSEDILLNIVIPCILKTKKKIYIYIYTYIVSKKYL